MGLGYIGLPTASLLANRGHKVHGVDVAEHVVSIINQGRIHIVEPALDVMVRSAVNSGNLVASLQPAPAQVFIVAVPTPFKEGFKPDLTYVQSATEAIAPHIRAGNLVILESTSPPGTTEAMAAQLEALRPDLCEGGRSFFVAHCPERVLPGQILQELVGNDRIVGGVDKASTQEAVAFYESFVQGAVLPTDARTAEMAKLVENSYRDVNIAFANELSLISDRLGIDVWDLIRLANRHPRVEILRPGPGVGGHCLAVDPWFIVDRAPEQSRLIRTAREINDDKADWVVERVQARAERFRAPLIACLGLAYKPDVDDLRESPALHITQALAEVHGDRVMAVEPNLHELGEMKLWSVDEALDKADIVVALVSHREFKEIPAERLHAKVLIDTCGVFR